MALTDLKIRVLENPSENEIKAVKRFSTMNWGSHTETQTEINLNYYDTPSFLVLAYGKGTLLGIQLVFTRYINFASQTFHIAGLGGLVVHTQYRYKGIATALLVHTLSILKDKKIDLAMLCTDLDRLGYIYKKVGFVALGRPYYFNDKEGREKSEQGGMITKVCNARAVDLIINCNDKLFIGNSNF